MEGHETIGGDGPAHARRPLLAMNEGNGACDKRFANAGIEQTEQERSRYRVLIITTPGLGGKRERGHSLRRDDPTGAGPERHGGVVAIRASSAPVCSGALR